VAEKVKDMWLKVLIGFIFSLIVLVTSLGANKLDKKVDKTVFDMHERYQSKQFDSIKTYQKEQFDGIKAYQKERFDDFKNALDDMKVK
jgi:hypothetical protein